MNKIAKIEKEQAEQNSVIEEEKTEVRDFFENHGLTQLYQWLSDNVVDIYIY